MREMDGLQDRAREILDRNAKKGDGYYYVAPSPRKYPHQWSWDSSFHAIVNAGLGRVHLAMEEVLTLLGRMLPDGRLPHIVCHGRSLTSLTNRVFRRHWPQPDRSPFVQPPVVALAVKEIWELSGDASFLREALPFLKRHFDWLSKERRMDGSKLVSIFSPWESGLDHKPAFDRLLGSIAGLPLGLYLALYLLEVRIGLRRHDPAEVVKRGLFNVKEVLFNSV
ncbi:MAG: hypothetical protein IBX68_10910 [Dehalococcoidia bacterium]|nr:hypothetical protein [Dehalococcoidia bacterium]